MASNHTSSASLADNLLGNWDDQIAAACQLLRLWATGDFGDQAVAVGGRKFLGVLVLVNSGTVRVLMFFEVPEYVPVYALLNTLWKGDGRDNMRQKRNKAELSGLKGGLTKLSSNENIYMSRD